MAEEKKQLVGQQLREALLSGMQWPSKEIAWQGHQLKVRQPTVAQQNKLFDLMGVKSQKDLDDMSMQGQTRAAKYAATELLVDSTSNRVFEEKQGDELPAALCTMALRTAVELLQEGVAAGKSSSETAPA